MKQTNSAGRRQSFLGGAFILVLATVIVKIIGAVYKLPLLNILTTQGTGYYNTAYSIYLPVYVLATAGLPAAVSRLVSEQYSKKNYADIRRILRVTVTCFLVTGTVGALAVFFAPDIIPESWNLFDPNARLAIKALAPTVFFVCLMSAHRGYNEGLRNMYPTGISQVLEAVCKLVVGLGCSGLAISYGMECFESGQSVFGRVCATQQEAMDVILPIAAAGGIIGVTLGAMLGMIFLFARQKFRGDGITPEMIAASPEPRSKSELFRSLLKIAVPIAVGAIALNLSSMIDNFTINNRIASLTETNPDFILAHFAPLFDPADKLHLTGLDRLPNYLWGLYGYGLVFYNLVPMITQNFGISALPSITHCWTADDHEGVRSNVERAIRITALIAYPCALGLCVLSEPILTLFYGDTIGSYGVSLAAPLMQILSVTLIFSAMCTPFGSILQAFGRPDLQVKFVFGGIAIKTVLNIVLVGIPSFNITGAPVGTFACFTFIFFAELYKICSIGNIRLKFTTTFFKPLLGAVLCGAGAWAVYGLAHGPAHLSNLMSTAFAVAAGVIIYVAALLITRAIQKDDILSLKKGEKVAKLLEKWKLIG